MPENKRCYGCMKEIGNNTVCPYCGYIEGTPHIPTYLPPGTLLQQRYQIGKLLRYNGEGASYIAFDQVIESIVEIREYLPDTLANREENHLNVHVIAGCETQYKALMSDFIELNQSLSKMRTLTHLVQVYEVFEENNTVYAVHEHVDGMTLREYLTENAGELSWNEAQTMFLPLLNTLSVLHGMNIIHRGISPETIFVTAKKELKLGGFCISATRAARTELAAEMFAGYAAPEQYSASSWHGSWTDVYSICAVLYKVLTGTMPPEAMSRSVNDNLIAPHSLNSSIPRQVSNAIMMGLKLSPDNRIQMMPDLMTKLNALSAVDEPEEDEPVTLVEEEDEEEKKSGKKYMLITMGITAAILLVVGVIVVIFALSGRNEKDNQSTFSLDLGSQPSAMQSPNPNASGAQKTSEAEKPFGMPNLVGAIYDSVKANSHYSEMLKFKEVYDYNEQYQKGVIYEQSIKPDTAIGLNTPVTIKISKGTRFPKIPSYSGLMINSYIPLLQQYSIPFEIKYEAVPEMENGYVFRTDRAPEMTIDISGSEKLIVYVVSNPPEPSINNTQSDDQNQPNVSSDQTDVNQ